MPRDAEGAGNADLHIDVALAVADVALAYHEVDNRDFYSAFYQGANVNIWTTESTSISHINFAWSHA